MYLVHKTADGSQKVEPGVLFVPGNKASEGIQLSAGLASFAYPMVNRVISEVE